MGLSDLKKNAMSSSSLQHSLSLDEFIEAANLYAMGQSLNKIKSNLDHKADATVTKTTDMARSHSNVLSLHKQSLETDVLFPAKVETKTHYRKATFSLSEAAITHLATLAEESSISKSKLLRLLIEQHFDLPIALRQLREQQRQHR
ncbi:CopG family transcriptional regulator [Shewanella sp. SW36]|uniref:CopG family transcriptional regulator n=1 Tax=Shewanella oncorhynchi TaxID=2726434 RepID=A0AA50Q802_9GAMM|nr:MULTISPECIES: CopG family transcriptional regulator [Shewanella]MCU7977673.1 CopG family transcriptional regulator [Shewanella sp. SW36]MCU7992931.1 CopG family transcriptional regulator [Shewanella sp. SW1]MCU8014112.1 CopG family transcriptional regulator [Shewanella sp. SM74]MCU8019449.1 CopG family transcriptional regulator [Shewanella sp. SM72]MCU8054176.1 CopG family transcriptional regulator [Shewanella sp. SM43]